MSYKYRIATLLPEKALTAAGTELINLNLSDLISKIQVTVKATSVGTATSDHPAAMIQNIQVIDGSTVLANLSGKEAQIFSYFQNGKFPYNFVTDLSGQIAIATADIDFGEFLWDQKYAFDPTKYVNPQLKITHNIKAVDASATTGTVEAHAYLQKAGTAVPIGHLMPREFATWGPTASGSTQNIMLPVDKLIRKIAVTAWNPGQVPEAVVSHIRMDENMDSAVPVDIDTFYWNEEMDALLWRVNEFGILTGSASARACYFASTKEIAVQAMQTAVTDIVCTATIPVVEPISHTDVAAHSVQCEVSGWRPHGGIIIPFGYADDPAAWYDPTGVQNLRLRLTAGAGYSGATVAVVLDQIMKY